MRLIGCFLAAALAPVLVAAQTYPIIFDDKELLRDFGIEVGDWAGPPVPKLENRCYYYGDGGYTITLSDAFLETYAERGFSTEAVCLGMLAGYQYDPTTGKLLETFQVADFELLERYDWDGVYITGVLGLELPACFVEARPLAMCDFIYDPYTGEKLPEERRDHFAELGAEVDRKVAEALKAPPYDRRCQSKTDDQSTCYFEIDPWSGSRTEQYPIAPIGPIGFFAVSDALEAGFGYALHADGTAGPSAEIGDKKLLLDPKRRASLAVIEGITLGRK